MFEALKGIKIYDWSNFKNLFDGGDEEKEPRDLKLEGLAYVKIFEENILSNAQTKINERITHKNISSVLQRRLKYDLKDYLE